MKIRINQAIYGEKNNAHTLLEHTFSDSKIPKDVTLKTDLPSGHVSFPSWDHFHSAIGYGNYYIVMKIFPDSEAQRSNFVYTHALFINKDDLEHVNDIGAIFRFFPETLDKGLKIESAEIEIEPTSDQEITDATKKVAYGILGNSSPVVWLGKEGFLDAMRVIWSNLWRNEKFNFQFRVSFGPKDIENTKEQLIYTPESLKDKWEGHFVVRKNDTFEEEYTESIAYLIEGPEKAPSISTITQQLDISVSSIQELKNLSLLVELLQKEDFNNLLNAITLIQRLTSSVKQGASLKSKLITKLVEILKNSGLKELLALRNLSQEHLSGFSIIPDTFKTVLTVNFYSSEHVAQAIDILDSLNGESEKWWSKTVKNFLSKSMEVYKDQHAKFFWNVVGQNHKALNILKEYTPDQNEVESSIIEHTPKKMDKELLKQLIDFSKNQKWLSLHALLCTMCFEPHKALEEQLSIDTNPNFIDAISIFSEKISAKTFIDFTVKNGDTRLVQLSSNLTEKKPDLLNDIDVSNATWIEIWKCRTEKGIAPFKGFKKPYSIVFDLINKLAEGEQVSVTLLSSISKSNYASLLKYSNRKNVWSLLQGDVRKQFLKATALDWLDSYSTKTQPGSIELENELKNEVLQEKYIESLFNEQRYRSENILSLLESVSTLSETTFLTFLSTRANSLDNDCCQRIGQIIKTRIWSNAYRKVKFELLPLNNSFGKSIDVCKGTFPLIDNPIYSGLNSLFGGGNKASGDLNEINKNIPKIKDKMESVVILTAIDVEYNAVKGFLDSPREIVHSETETIYDTGTFGNKWNVIIVETGAGNQKAAAEAQRAIAYFNPTYALFIGIAGGLKDVNIGDVVVASKVYGYETGKSDKEYKPRFEFGRSSHSLESRAKSLRRDKKWLKEVSQQLSQQLAKDIQVEAYVKPIAAGEKVVSSTDSETFKFLKKNASDALAVEMEGIGFLEVCHAYPNIKYALVRGISDLLDNKSQTDNEGGQELASLTAAAFAFEMLNRIEKSQK